MTRPRKRGPRPSGDDARQAILDAARATFGDRGFTGATIRAIATEAGVDPALVMHYFGNKADLFAAAMHMPISPTEELTKLADVDPEDLGEAVLRLILGVWEDPEALAVWLGLIRSSTSSEPAAQLLAEFLTDVVLQGIGQRLTQPDIPYRTALVASQIVGLGITRHVLKLEPLASATPDHLIEAVAPILQHYLTGDIDTGDIDPPQRPR